MRTGRNILLVAIGVTILLALVAAPLAARDYYRHTYTFQLRLPDGEVAPLAVVSVYNETSWGYIFNGDGVQGTVYSGVLPPAPDVAAEKVAVFEVTKDDGATGMRGVFSQFPPGALLLISKDDKLMTEVGLTIRAEATESESAPSS